VKYEGMDPIAMPNPKAMLHGDRFDLQICGSSPEKLAWRMSADILQGRRTVQVESRWVEVDRITADLYADMTSAFIPGTTRPATPQPRIMEYRGGCYEVRHTGRSDGGGEG
jgi:hypothetical protein